MAEIRQEHGRDGDSGRRKRVPKPLDQARLEELALAYVARFATSATKLQRYLKRKLRERGWAGEGEPDIAGLAERYAELGYIDDEAFARARSSSLLRRGYGPRRIGQALGEAGIDAHIQEDIRPGETAAREAALAYARKRRFGAFGGGGTDPAAREKQIAAILRAGHSFDHARFLIDAPTIRAIEQWLAEADDYES